LFSYKNVADAAADLAAQKGKDLLINVLAAFGAANGRDLKPEQYGPFIETAKSHLEA
jgi:hypothetical protein